MKFVDKSTVHELVRRAILHLAYELPQDISAGLCAMCGAESDPLAKSVLQQLGKNDEISRTEKLPICQDTGTVRVLLEIGKNVSVAGDVFDEVDAAVAEAYIKGKLRLSTVRDAILDRTNTGDNTPAFCEVRIIEELDVARLSIMIKGGGSDNASRVVMLVPGDGRDGIVREVVKCVHEKGSSACPPLVIGVGIGGTFDSVATMAQRALYRPIGQASDDGKIAELEQQILDEVNKSNVGPAGLGGSSTCMQVSVISEACHIAAMPLAIDMGCSATRRCTIDVPLCSVGTNCTVGFDEIEEALQAAFVRPNVANKQAADFVSEQISSHNIVNSSEEKLDSHIKLPVKHNDLAKLKAGDKVYLSGPIFTLRDAGHIRLLAEMKDGKLPYGLEGQTIYYAGPTPEKNGMPFGSIGPTTASRMDFAAPALYDGGVVATIGKGKRNKDVHDSCVKNGTVFFAAIGGSAAYLAKCVKSAEVIAYEDLGPEALRRCEVEDLPVYVAIDTKGNDIYERE